VTRDRWYEASLVVLFAGCVCFQLFVPPSVGLADNGDFGRLIDRFDLGPADKVDSDQYSYFTTQWIYDPTYHWTSDNFSSELILICGALLIGWTSSTNQFDIRIMGSIHALLWIGCFIALLVAIRPLAPRIRWATAIAGLFILTDASYVTMCNSFYMDTAAFLFLAWAVALWLSMATGRRPSLGLFWAFSIASALCLMSKSQHAPLGVFLWILAGLAALRFEGRKRKAAAFAISLIIPLGAWTAYRLMPITDARMPQYSVVFRKILESTRTPDEDLRDLGLGPEYARYIARDRDPLPDFASETKWWDDFLGRATRGRVMLFHLRHPWRALAMMYRDLKTHAPDRRLRIVGKYERASGMAPRAQVESFSWWTDFRSALFRFAPWHILVWFAAVCWMSIRLLIRGSGSAEARVAGLCLALAAMALAEFAVSSLSDSGETERHLFLFHVLTDFTILLAVAWLSHRLSRNSAILPPGPTAQPEPSGAKLTAW
jgi:hypothetical protein